MGSLLEVSILMDPHTLVEGCVFIEEITERVAVINKKKRTLITRSQWRAIDPVLAHLAHGKVLLIPKVVRPATSRKDSAIQPPCT